MNMALWFVVLVSAVFAVTGLLVFIDAVIDLVKSFKKEKYSE